MPDAATAVLYAADLLDAVDNDHLAGLLPLDVRRHFLEVERALLQAAESGGPELEYSQIYHKLIFDMMNQELDLARSRGADGAPLSPCLLEGAHVPRGLVSGRPGWPASGEGEEQAGGEGKGAGRAGKAEAGEFVRRYLLARVGEVASIGEVRWCGTGERQRDLMEVEAQLECEVRAMDKEWVSREHYQGEEGHVLLELVDALLDDLLLDSVRALAVA